MREVPGSNVVLAAPVFRRWNSTKRPLGMTSSRLAEVLLNRWESSTPEEQGIALLAASHTKPVRRQRQQQPEPASA
jgi:hypothetical protein